MGKIHMPFIPQRSRRRAQSAPAADDPIVSLLVELPGFLEAFGPFVFPDRHHTQYLSFFDCYFYFITKSLIMPLERLPQIRQVQEE